MLLRKRNRRGAAVRMAVVARRRGQRRGRWVGLYEKTRGAGGDSGRPPSQSKGSGSSQRLDGSRRRPPCRGVQSRDASDAAVGPHRGLARAAARAAACAAVDATATTRPSSPSEVTIASPAPGPPTQQITVVDLMPYLRDALAASGLRDGPVNVIRAHDDGITINSGRAASPRTCAAGCWRYAARRLLDGSAPGAGVVPTTTSTSGGLGGRARALPRERVGRRRPRRAAALARPGADQRALAPGGDARRLVGDDPRVRRQDGARPVAERDARRRRRPARAHRRRPVYRLIERACSVCVRSKHHRSNRPEACAPRSKPRQPHGGPSAGRCACTEALGAEERDENTLLGFDAAQRDEDEAGDDPRDESPSVDSSVPTLAHRKMAYIGCRAHANVPCVTRWCNASSASGDQLEPMLTWTAMKPSAHASKSASRSAGATSTGMGGPW